MKSHISKNHNISLCGMLNANCAPFEKATCKNCIRIYMAYETEKSTLTILTWDRKKVYVEGYVSRRIPQLGIARAYNIPNKWLWTITHIPSGLKFGERNYSLPKARRVLYNLAQYSIRQNIDWEIEFTITGTPNLPDEYRKHITEIQKILGGNHA